MRLFQNSGLYPAYLPRLARLTKGCSTFDASRDAFLADRYGACHFLQPVLAGDPLAFFTNGDDANLQRQWAGEHGLPGDATLESILLAQIEHHRTEVFYNLDPMRYGTDFVRKLPGCVKKTIAWRAAPSPGADFGAYDAVVCNFPSILQSYRNRGWRAAYFSIAHDPEMDVYAANTDRPIDVMFAGGYSRHHRQRAEVLETVAAQRTAANTVFHLDRSKLTKLAESRLGQWFPLAKHRRPLNIRAVSAAPVFGRELYAAFSKAKIVLNGAIDMAGKDRGNMRCFEAMGCGSLLISDAGNYPSGMLDNQTLITYSDPQQAANEIRKLTVNADLRLKIAKDGQQLVRCQYTKAMQWEQFQQLVALT